MYMTVVLYEAKQGPSLDLETTILDLIRHILTFISVLENAIIGTHFRSDKSLIWNLPSSLLLLKDTELITEKGYMRIYVNKVGQF